jgi:bacterial/archaeal transporter family protein
VRYSTSGSEREPPVLFNKLDANRDTCLIAALDTWNDFIHDRESPLRIAFPVCVWRKISGLGDREVSSVDRVTFQDRTRRPAAGSVVIVKQHRFVPVLGDTKRMTWIVWALLSALFAAATALLAKLGVTGIDSNVATAVRTTVVVAFTWLMAYLTRQPGGFRITSTKTWIFLVLSGFATGLSWLCYFRALQLGPASRVAPVDKLSVVLVILFAAAFLGERLTWGKGIGGLLIVAGVILAARD